MDDRYSRLIRALVAAGVALCAVAACKREPPSAGGSPVAPAPRGDGGASAAAFTLDAADSPGTTARPLRVVFGSRGAGVAWVVERADGTHVVHDGRPGNAVQAVDQIALSPDGRRIAYSAQVDGAWRMLVDGAPLVESASAVDPVFSPDGRHVAYVVGVGDAKRVVVDGREGPSRRDIVGPPVFSADSGLVAVAEVPAEGQPARLAVSDVSLAGGVVKGVGLKQLVADDARTALAAVVEEKGKERVDVLGFSRGGAAAKGPVYDGISEVVLADGGPAAYVAVRAGVRLLVLGDRESPLPEASPVAAPVIRPDRAAVGVLLASSGGQFLYEAFAGADPHVGQRYDEAADLVYSPDGRSTAFCARRGGSWFLVVNGNEGPPFDRAVTPAFSADGTRVVYRARKDGRRFVVVADASARTLRQLAPYEQVFPARFTADGKAITYGIKDGRRLEWRIEPL